jgi:hypothetical protein
MHGICSKMITLARLKPHAIDGNHFFIQFIEFTYQNFQFLIHSLNAAYNMPIDRCSKNLFGKFLKLRSIPVLSLREAAKEISSFVTHSGALEFAVDQLYEMPAAFPRIVKREIPKQVICLVKKDIAIVPAFVFLRLFATYKLPYLFDRFSFCSMDRIGNGITFLIIKIDHQAVSSRQMIC